MSVFTPGQQAAHERILAILDASGADYKRFTHRVLRNYEDAELARQESGFSGTESKSMVLKSGDALFVYVTLAGRRVDFKAMRATIGGPRPKLVNDDELRERMGAEPGNAFPFGFEESIPIFVDPDVYVEEWLLLSPAVPTETIQMRGADLKRILESVANSVTEVTTFNQPQPVD